MEFAVYSSQLQVRQIVRINWNYTLICPLFRNDFLVEHNSAKFVKVELGDLTLLTLVIEGNVQDRVLLSVDMWVGISFHFEVDVVCLLRVQEHHPRIERVDVFELVPLDHVLILVAAPDVYYTNLLRF